LSPVKTRARKSARTTRLRLSAVLLLGNIPAWIWFFTFTAPSLIGIRWRPCFSSSSNKPWISFVGCLGLLGLMILFTYCLALPRSVLKCDYSFSTICSSSSSRAENTDQIMWRTCHNAHLNNLWNNSDRYTRASPLQGWKTLLFPNFHTSTRHPLSRKMWCQLQWFGSKHPPYRWALNALHRIFMTGLQIGEYFLIIGMTFHDIDWLLIIVPLIAGLESWLAWLHRWKSVECSLCWIRLSLVGN